MFTIIYWAESITGTLWNQCPNVSLNNQREITLILKRDKRKSISAVVNKKHFKEYKKLARAFPVVIIMDLLSMKDYIPILYTIIVFCWGQYQFLWTLKTIFTESFRLRWISFLRSIKTRIDDTKDCNCFITLKWKVKVKPSQYEINQFIMTSYIMQRKVKVKASQYEF